MLFADHVFTAATNGSMYIAIEWLDGIITRSKWAFVLDADGGAYVL